MKQSYTPFRALRHGRSTQVALSSLVLLSSALSPVIAGEYVLDRIETADGEVYESTSTPTTRPWLNNFPESASASKYIPSETAYSVGVGSSGKVRAVFKWQASGPNDNPPEDGVLRVNVHSYTYVPASVSYGQPAGTLSGLIVDNGFGRPVIANNYGNNYSYTCQGNNLVQVKTNGQTEVPIPYITMTGQVTISGTTGSGGSATAGAYHAYDAYKDNRGVHLYRSGAVYEWTDNEGNTHGDTIYSALRTDSALWRENWQDIYAVCEGFTPSVPATWQWNPTGGSVITNIEDTWDYTHQKMPYGSLAYREGFNTYVGEASGNTTRIISYKATDALDGAEAKAKYYLTLHDEAERSGDDEVTNVLVEGTMWTGTGTAVVWGPTAASSQELATGTASSTGWSFGGGVDVEAGLFKVLPQFNVGGEYTSSHEESITQNAILPFEVPADCYTYPMFRHTYVRTRTPFRHWTEAGEHKIIVHNSPYPDDELDHHFIKDVYSGQQIFWHEPVPSVVPAPTRDPNDSPPTTPVED